MSVRVYYFLVTNTGDWVFDVEAEDGMKLIKYSHVHACNDNFFILEYYKLGQILSSAAKSERNGVDLTTEPIVIK